MCDSGLKESNGAPPPLWPPAMNLGCRLEEGTPRARWSAAPPKEPVECSSRPEALREPMEYSRPEEAAERACSPEKKPGSRSVPVCSAPLPGSPTGKGFDSARVSCPRGGGMRSGRAGEEPEVSSLTCCSPRPVSPGVAIASEPEGAGPAPDWKGSDSNSAMASSSCHATECCCCCCCCGGSGGGCCWEDEAWPPSPRSIRPPRKIQ
mmetsp:Transcript_3022/g.8615  ORF Transcript_3022/g.8615 Transcript_3022/m.8615 type:complete len:207 (-) Transcript_3022:613-1233(-)